MKETMTVRKQARFRPLTQKEAEEVNDYTTNDSCNPDTVFTTENINFSREKLACMRPLIWLNDEIINVSMLLLQKRCNDLCARDPNRKPSHFFNSFLMYNLLKGISVTGWTKKLNVFGMDKIYIPINHKDIHWLLGVICVQLHEIHLYESMIRGPRKRNDKYSMYFNELEKWILCEQEQSSPQLLTKKTQWKMIFHEDSPQQWDFDQGLDDDGNQIFNLTECGVFLIMTADFLNDGLELDRNSFGNGIENMAYFRTKIVNDIIRGDLIYPN